MKISNILILLSTLAGLLILSGSNAIAQVNDDELVASLSKKLDLEISNISDSPVPGLKQIVTDRGIFYVSDNGEYFLQARVYNIKNGIEDETEIALRNMRLQGIERFKESAIEFKAADEKYVVNVFTDATCGYCRKLHNEMNELNELGITVRYLAFPRAGLNSKEYQEAVSIWCSSDPHQAMTDAKAGKSVDNAQCENKVAQQYQFGLQIGVRGTPNIILPDGTVVAGYKPAQALAQELSNNS
jgi:thiol:disulfide interchange protein DsbC